MLVFGIVLLFAFFFISLLGSEGAFRINSNLDDTMFCVSVIFFASGLPLTMIGAIDYAT